MGQRELKRWHLMELVKAEKITLTEAGEKIGVSYRQAKRIGRAIRERGIKGLVHGNRGRPSNHRLKESLRERVLKLSKEVYWDFNDTHFTEKLRECEGIDLNRETVRKLRREMGMAPKRKRRGPKHRKRRERKAQEGWMVLWDGSPHPWFGPEHPPCCLMAAIDDATGKVLAARFFPFESSSGYLWLLREVVKGYGIPLVIYHDRHGSLYRNDSHWSLEEQLAGRQEPTQVGLALEALGIDSIAALSPQAKGRIERLFGTLQDRLIAELGLKGVQGLEEANRFLKTYIPMEAIDEALVEDRDGHPPGNPLSSEHATGSVDASPIPTGTSTVPGYPYLMGLIKHLQKLLFLLRLQPNPSQRPLEPHARLFLRLGSPSLTMLRPSLPLPSLLREPHGPRQEPRAFSSFPDERNEGLLTLLLLQQIEFELSRYGIAPPSEAFHLCVLGIDNSPQRDQTSSQL
jgi:transposase